MTRIRRFTILAAAVCAAALDFNAGQSAFGQSIRAEVKLITERLPLDKQKKIEPLTSDLETYLNDYDWTGQESDAEIPLSVQIYLQDISASYEDRYSGTFLISNTTDLQYFDKYWQFPLVAGARLLHDDNVYDPFLGFINFYMNLILGGEFDKYSPLGGSPFYEKAKLINDQAKYNTQFFRGWEEREKLLKSLCSAENAPFRKCKNLFYAAFYALSEQDTSAAGLCVQGVGQIETVLKRDPEHKEALDFLKSHYMDIADLLKDNPAVLRRLAAVDPAHQETYQRPPGE
jgi:hypothetical protein